LTLKLKLLYFISGADPQALGDPEPPKGGGHRSPEIDREKADLIHPVSADAKEVVYRLKATQLHARTAAAAALLLSQTLAQCDPQLLSASAPQSLSPSAPQPFSSSDPPLLSSSALQLLISSAP